MQGDIIVHLQGEFVLSDTIEFTPEDSGTNGFSIIYKGDNATLHGGRKVEGWKQVEGSPIWQVELPDVSDFRQLYVGENRAKRSRSKWLYWMEAEWDDSATSYDAFEEGYIIKGKDFPEGFKKPDELEMCFLPSWKSWRVPVSSMETLADGNILVKPDQPYFNTMQAEPTPISEAHVFYFENAPEFFDEPGEFYFNKDTHILSYYPTEYEDMTSIDCYIPVVEGLISLKGESKNERIENISFEGINFRCSAWERPTEQGFGTTQADSLLDSVYSDEFGNTIQIPAAVQIEYGDNINFIKNEIAFVGAGGISYGKACSNSEVIGNIFDCVAATSLSIGTWKHEKDAPIIDLARKIEVKNNLVRRTGVEYMTPAMTSYHTNSVIFDHNDIKDTPYSGFSVGWGWGKDVVNNKYNMVTNNRIENSGYKLRDGGSIYSLDSNAGGIIKGNYMLNPQDQKGGIYLDNASAYWTITDNVIDANHDVRWLKLTYHTIHDNEAYNNYANTELINLYPENNNIFEAASDKVFGEWPDEAKKIIAKAGLENEYKYLIYKYESKGILRNDILERQPYHEFTNPGIFISAGGDFLTEGGEGVAFHEVMGDEWANGVPDSTATYFGTGGYYLRITAEGEWTTYKFTVDEAGEYDICPNLGVVLPGTAVTIEIDGKAVCNNLKLSAKCASFDNFALYNAGSIYLEKGEHTLKLIHAVKRFSADGIFIKKSTDEFGERKEGYIKEYMDIILS